MSTVNLNDKDNKLCNILDDIVITKIINKLQSEIGKDSASLLTLYFIYRIRHFGIDSYLLTQSGTINAEISFTERFFEKNTLQKSILKVEELHCVVDYALSLSEVNELLDEVSIDNLGSLNSYEKLYYIIDMFNTCSIEKLNKLRKCGNGEDFKLLLKIALLSIPQLDASEEYSGFSSSKLFIDGEEKYKKCTSLVKDFNDGKIDNNLPDRLLLLVTIIEGYLWIIKTNKYAKKDNGGLLDFCIGDLYDILNSGINNISLADENLKKEIIYNLQTNWFYLRQLRFYIYGQFKTNNTKHLEKLLFDVFISNLSDLILFAKSIIAKSNVDNVKKWTELSNSLVPKSVAHGLLSISLPKKIGIFNLDDKMKFKATNQNSCFELKAQSIENLEQLKNPWALYKPYNADINNEIDSIDTELIDNLRKNGVLVTQKHLIIKTTNTLSKSQYIILEVNQEEKDVILTNFSYYRYVFKSFVEKLQDINHSAGLNLNTSFWYKKAFCNLYKDYDKIRYKKQYPKDFRKWEIEKIKELIGSKSDTVIYDIGACDGRLEQKIIADKDLIKKVNTIYAIDQNQDYLADIIKDDKIQTHRCDFRSIGLIDNKRADLICFTHTVFGYFNNDADNKLVLRKALDMLADDGVIIIDQFNPQKPPKHCNKKNVPVYDFLSDGCNYRCIKTSNHKTPNDTKKPYGLYYGNYIYFDISEEISEKIVKCDTYSIKLYTQEWFETTCNKLVDPNEFIIEIQTSCEDNNATMILTIKKSPKANNIDTVKPLPTAPYVPSTIKKQHNDITKNHIRDDS